MLLTVRREADSSSLRFQRRHDGLARPSDSDGRALERVNPIASRDLRQYVPQLLLQIRDDCFQTRKRLKQSSELTFPIWLKNLEHVLR